MLGSPFLYGSSEPHALVLSTARNTVHSGHVLARVHARGESPGVGNYGRLSLALRLYAECGVPEYWIVNLVERAVGVHHVPMRVDTSKSARIRRARDCAWSPSPTSSSASTILYAEDPAST